VIVNRSVALNGSAIDPDGDSITYAWQFSVVPTGSQAQIAQPNLAVTSFVPDLPGVYVATLTPSDFVGPGVSANATITATTATMFAEIQAQAAAEAIQALPADAVTTIGNQNALVQHLSNAALDLESGNPIGAQQQLEEAIARTDGCVLRGVPDGNGSGRDWITSCAAQEQIYPVLAAALAAINP